MENRDKLMVALYKVMVALFERKMTQENYGYVYTPGHVGLCYPGPHDQAPGPPSEHARTQRKKLVPPTI